ncbi:MAG: Do family serine endopeptidase [Bacteroidetes bacterium]|nr:Do family serine endopeptidase [Bacteroidota bacterium]MBX7045339.1 Do family serine endopeptidase [Ignavibacteria bacterium]
MSKKSIIAAAFLVMFAVAFGGILIASFSGIKPIVANTPIDFKTTPPIQSVNPTLKGLNEGFVEISKAVTPTVVNIEVTGNSKGENSPHQDIPFFFGPDGQQAPDQDMPSKGTGTGFIISNDGYIMTNNHVVKNANENGIKVQMNDKREFTAHLIGTDPNTDVAVIKIDAKDLPVASLGNSDDVQVGQWVLAVGNPLQLNSTVTAGIVSALGRNINIDGNSYAINNFIQTDAAINPGNSGGPLVDISGSVIGINSAIKSQSGYYQGYGFAIPINLAKSVATELIKSGKISRGYIGVSIKDVDQKEAKGLGMDKAQGVLIQDVLKGGAGENAGLKVGDVILSVDGKNVNAANELQTIIGQKRPGDVAALKVYRDGKTMDMSVTLKARDENQNAASNTTPKEESKKSEPSMKSFEKTGFSVTDLTGSQKEKFDVSGGVYVTSVKRFSESFERGLREGLIIIEADKKSISNVSELESIINGKSKGDILVLKVKTEQGQVRLVAIEIQ